MFTDKKAVLTIVIINVLVFSLGLKLKVMGMSLNILLENKGALLLGGASPGYFQDIYRYITSIFLHASYEHIYNNMITLIIFGFYLSSVIGNVRFLIVYLLGGIFANIASVYYYNITRPNDFILSIGASGAVYAIIGAFIIIAIYKRASFLRANILRSILIILGGIFFGASAGVNNTAHLAGFIFGAIIMLFIIVVKGVSKTKRRSNG